MAVSRRLLLCPVSAHEVKHRSFALKRLVSSKVQGLLQLIGPPDAAELNPGKRGVRWLGAAPGAAGENFLIHLLKKIEGSEGAKAR